MIVDTSAIISIVAGERGSDVLAEAIAQAPHVAMSAATFVELFAVVDSRFSPQSRRRVEELLDLWGVDVVDVDTEQAHLARAAYADFGKGSGHPARLNFGDVFSYALARSRKEPLLFVGDDFAATDVAPAIS